MLNLAVPVVVVSKLEYLHTAGLLVRTELRQVAASIAIDVEDAHAGYLKVDIKKELNLLFRQADNETEFLIIIYYLIY